ncbi:hypothetical protein J6590_050804 [Homalodisca vitripennis]|nr:hypothetical protein J6590_050804 [Homalodisca vitripennis]
MRTDHEIYRQLSGIKAVKKSKKNLDDIDQMQGSQIKGFCFDDANEYVFQEPCKVPEVKKRRKKRARQVRPAVRPAPRPPLRPVSLSDLGRNGVIILLSGSKQDCAFCMPGWSSH